MPSKQFDEGFAVLKARVTVKHPFAIGVDGNGLIEGVRYLVAVTAVAKAGGKVKMLIAVTGGKNEEKMVLFTNTLGESTELKVGMEKPADYNTSLLQKLTRYRFIVYVQYPINTPLTHH